MNKILDMFREINAHRQHQEHTEQLFIKNIMKVIFVLSGVLLVIIVRYYSI